MPTSEAGKGSERFRSALLLVTGAMDEAGIRWCLTGSMASSHYGVPRATMDVDVVAEMRPVHVLPLCSALSGRFYVSQEAVASAVLRSGSFNLIHFETALKVDVFVLKDAPWDRESFARRRREDVHPFGPCFLPGPEDLLLGKLAWYEKGGRASERQWSDILGILRTQGDALDLDYLARWSRELSVEHLLADATRDARREGR